MIEIFKKTPKLLPHHVVVLVDKLNSGTSSVETERQFIDKGGWVGFRINDLLNLPPDTLIKITVNPRKDSVCTGNRNFPQNCFGISNRNIWGFDCLNPKNRIVERRIAKEMGLRVGRTYPISELMEARNRTCQVPLLVDTDSNTSVFV